MIQRTTVAADSDDLAVLRAEASRREVPLSQVLREAVTRHADALRDSRMPRFGRGASGSGAAKRGSGQP
ncbi:MAG: ribbon-helix-helix protein, CopG family [Geodermatophilaceae bacterium]